MTRAFGVAGVAGPRCLLTGAWLGARKHLDVRCGGTAWITGSSPVMTKFERVMTMCERVMTKFARVMTKCQPVMTKCARVMTKFERM